MLIDYESIIIIDGKAAHDIMSGQVKTDICQKSSARGFKDIGFVRNNAVIQCISPSNAEIDEKIKFSVVYKPAVSLDFDFAAVVFSDIIEGSFEIRSQNQTVCEGNCRMSGIIISLSDTEGKLELEFTEKDETDKIINLINEISDSNKKEESELLSLENLLEDEKKRRESLVFKKQDISDKISQLRLETEKMTEDIAEISDLEARRDILKRNLEENSHNREKMNNLRNQLECYSSVFEFYKNETGYSTVKEKIDEIISDMSVIENHIAEFARKRSEEAEEE